MKNRLKRLMLVDREQIVLILGICILVFCCSCAFLQAAAGALGTPAPGESPTLAHSALMGAARLAPNWAYNAILGLTTALGFYRDHRKKGSFTLVAESFERMKSKVDILKLEILEAIESEDYERVKTLLLSSDRIEDISAEFTRGKPFYADMMSMIYSARKKMRKRDAA